MFHGVAVGVQRVGATGMLPPEVNLYPAPNKEADSIVNASLRFFTCRQNLRELVKMHVQKHHHKELTVMKKKVEELTTTILRWQTSMVGIQCKVAEVTTLKDNRRKQRRVSRRISGLGCACSA